MGNKRCFAVHESIHHVSCNQIILPRSDGKPSRPEKARPRTKIIYKIDDSIQFTHHQLESNLVEYMYERTVWIYISKYERLKARSFAIHMVLALNGWCYNERSSWVVEVFLGCIVGAVCHRD
uniref:Uncharacterized protein n=1 Tax=Alloyangia mangrovi TaxID=1779329 RepID=A0A2A3JYX8_9RHOB